MRKEPLIYTVETDERLLLRISVDGKVTDYNLTKTQANGLLRGLVSWITRYQVKK